MVDLDHLRRKHWIFTISIGPYHVWGEGVAVEVSVGQHKVHVDEFGLARYLAGLGECGQITEEALDMVDRLSVAEQIQEMSLLAASRMLEKLECIK